MPWYARNFRIYKEIELLRLNDFTQHLSSNFHLTLESTESIALNTIAEYEHYDPISSKCSKTDSRFTRGSI